MSRHHHHVDWKHLGAYGAVAVIVIAAGALAIWSFIERQSLVVINEPLPKVTVVTSDPNSRLAAAWVRLLTKADLPANLVTPDSLDRMEGVVFFCDAGPIPPRFSAHAIVIAGTPPPFPAGPFRISTDAGMSDDALQLTESASPILARLTPGTEVATHRVSVAMLKETPHMIIDARWRNSARAAIMHVEDGGSRCVWFGFDPDSLASADDPHLRLLIRTAFRWAAGQPVSDGAVGELPTASVLAPEARKKARAERFAFSADRLANPQLLSIRMSNRGTLTLENPTVKVWLPPDVRQVELAGDLIMRRGAVLRAAPDESACLISLRSLGRNEDRVMKLRVVKERPGAATVAER